MQLENIQDLLSDAMEMAQGEELAAGIDPEIVDAIASILGNWVTNQVAEPTEEEADMSDLLTSLVTSAAACAYIAGRLESMQDNIVQTGTVTYEVEPTHPEAQHVTINLNFR